MTPETQPGRKVGGRYRLVVKLGSGGFGRVWKAHDEFLGIDVAVKEVWLPPAMSASEQAERLARAEREARNAARLRDHAGIVAVHDVVIEDGVPWMIMQLVAGSSLEEHLSAHGPVPVEHAARIARSLLNALGAAHAAGIVHRDVKPANVMLGTGGEVLLTDFGIAVHQADTALTATGAFIGSVEYIAPERARGTDGRAASDLFSLGVTLYQAVEGVSPFRRDTPTGTLTAILFDPAPPPQCAGRLTELVNGLLAKDPKTRTTVPQALALIDPPSAAAAAVTEPVAVVQPQGKGRDTWPTGPAARMGPPARPPALPASKRAPEPTPQPSSPRKPALIAAVVVLAVLGCLIGVFWPTGGNDGTPGAGAESGTPTRTPLAQAPFGSSSTTTPTASAVPTTPTVDLPDPCDMRDESIEQFEFPDGGTSDDKPERRRCNWSMGENPRTPYRYAVVVTHSKPYALEPSSHPVRVAGAVTGQEFSTRPTDPGPTMYCFITWPTSFGHVLVSMEAASPSVSSDALCDSTRKWANSAHPSIPQ